LRTIAVFNQKGGAGKTTASVNLAAALAEKGKKVLLVDLDTQASASSSLGIRDAEDRGLSEVFIEEGSLSSCIRETDFSGLEIVPSSPWLARVEPALAGEIGAQVILQKALRKLPERWDFVILDCPPSLGLLSINALAAAREVLVPIVPHFSNMEGLAALLRTVEKVAEGVKGANPEVAGILLSQVDRRSLHVQAVEEELRGKFKEKVFRTVIRSNIRLPEAWAFGKPVIEYDTQSHGAEDYRALAAEVIKRERRS